MFIENELYRLEVDENCGAIVSLIFKETGYDFIGEKQILANFRLCLPEEDYLYNYVEGMEHIPNQIKKDGNSIIVSFVGMKTNRGSYDLNLQYSITFREDQIVFNSKLTNNTGLPVSEFWFPRLGGIKGFNANKDATLSSPGYLSINNNQLFISFPGAKGLGAEAAEFSNDYPGLMMPWWDIYDDKKDLGLYMGYHDKIYRFSTWHMYLYPNVASNNQRWLTPEEACGPVGLIFSHVRYPNIYNGESFETGEFILRLHKGDWHQGSMFYREWFMENFPFDKSGSWLRKESSWFSSIIYQPEDKVVTDYEGYDQWCQDAEEYGIGCHELIGWDKGGLERDYPEYVPEEKLGGREGFRKLLKSINDRGKKCLVFINYNIIDSCTDWYKKELYKYAHQYSFGQTPNWMAWGESTLLARKGLNVRRHHLASVVPPLVKILEGYFLDLVKDGAHGFQIDKLCVGSALDYNPLNTEKPDVALCEGLVKAIESLYTKCREINPEFRIASEAVQDRFIPYIDVYYRNSNAHNISPLRYVFPEWTSCQHIGTACDFNGVNGAILTGSVICVEPECYQDTLKNPMWKKMGEYIREVERIRKELKDIIFLGKYHDNQGGSIEPLNTCKTETENLEPLIGGEVMIPGGGGSIQSCSNGSLHFAVHGDFKDTRAIVVINTGEQTARYKWKFTHCDVKACKLYSPSEEVKYIKAGEALEIKGEGLHILVQSK